MSNFKNTLASVVIPKSNKRHRRGNANMACAIAHSDTGLLFAERQHTKAQDTFNWAFLGLTETNPEESGSTTLLNKLEKAEDSLAASEAALAAKDTMVDTSWGFRSEIRKLNHRAANAKKGSVERRILRLAIHASILVASRDGAATKQTVNSAVAHFESLLGGEAVEETKEDATESHERTDLSTLTRQTLFEICKSEEVPGVNGRTKKADLVAAASTLSEETVAQYL